MNEMEQGNPKPSLKTLKATLISLKSMLANFLNGVSCLYTLDSRPDQ